MESEIQFDATECHAGGTLKKAAYRFLKVGNDWTVQREGQDQVHLGAGYQPVRVVACGVCSTDLARPYLPFPLPQIIGHELLGQTSAGYCVIEINASHKARGLIPNACPYCQLDLHSHCPERVTLGIDRLPGGFGPWVLAPEQALLAWPEQAPLAAAVLTEPFAAALQALKVTPPTTNARVAVLGPRRLGMLLLAALATWREQSGTSFEISALANHSELLAHAAVLGADYGLNLSLMPERALAQRFDVVFDTTGKVKGLERALAMAKQVVHLKSTHGRQVMGMDHLSDFVIDELSLLPVSTEHMNYAWPGSGWKNRHVLVTPRAIDKLPRLRSPVTYHILEPEAAVCKLERAGYLEGGPLPQFDLAVVASLAEADRVIRPGTWGRSLVRPRGAILLAPGSSENALDSAIRERGLQIHSSRCGEFSEALAMFAAYPQLCETLAELMISHRFAADELATALAVAADSRAGIKVVVEHPTA